jgi:hypothetical protein
VYGRGTQNVRSGTVRTATLTTGLQAGTRAWSIRGFVALGDRLPSGGLSDGWPLAFPASQ